MFAGRPDWHAPTHWSGRPVHAVFEQPGRFLAAPRRLRTHSFGLDIYEQDRGDAGLANFSLLRLGFEADFDLDTLHQDPQSGGAGLSAMPAEAAWLRFHAAEALSLPPEVQELLPLDVAGLGAMGLTLRLDGAATSLFEGALRTGLNTVGARAWVMARGVAERWALTVNVDPSALLAALPGTTLPLSTLQERLLQAPDTLGLPVLQSVSGSGRETVVQALIDRLVERFGALVPGSGDGTPDSDVLVRFDPAAMPPGRVAWDLARPVLCPRLLTLEADPLAPLRELSPGPWDSLVRRHAVPALGSGWHSITVLPNLPAPRAGLLRTQLELAAAPHPPGRPFSSHSSATLPADGAPFQVTLRLGVDEPLHYQWKTRSYVTDAGGVAVAEGPWQEATRQHLVIGPAALGVRLLCVEADAALLREATLEVRAQGQRAGRPWSVQAEVDPAVRRVALAFPTDLRDVVVSALACARAGGQCRTTPALDGSVDTLYLDAFSFEGSGARQLTVHCTFDDDAAQAQLELAPEDRTGEPDRRTQVRLTPLSPQADWSWTALTPFHSGYRWRWAGQTAWSDALSPDVPLQLRSSQDPARSRP